jgi:hypothetical protein
MQLQRPPWLDDDNGSGGDEVDLDAAAVIATARRRQ